MIPWHELEKQARQRGLFDAAVAFQELQKAWDGFDWERVVCAFARIEGVHWMVGFGKGGITYEVSKADGWDLQTISCGFAFQFAGLWAAHKISSPGRVTFGVKDGDEPAVEYKLLSEPTQWTEKQGQ